MRRHRCSLPPTHTRHSVVCWESLKWMMEREKRQQRQLAGKKESAHFHANSSMWTWFRVFGDCVVCISLAAIGCTLLVVVIMTFYSSFFCFAFSPHNSSSIASLFSFSAVSFLLLGFQGGRTDIITAPTIKRLMMLSFYFICHVAHRFSASFFFPRLSTSTKEKENKKMTRDSIVDPLVNTLE